MYYTLENKDYFIKRNIILPFRITSDEEFFYTFTNVASIYNLIMVVVLRIVGIKIYFLPDGIFEITNLRRLKNLIGYIAIKLSSGVLCGDNYSLGICDLCGIKGVVCHRWSCNRVERVNDETIISTAKTAYFNNHEKDKLLNKLDELIRIEKSKTNILLSIPNELNVMIDSDLINLPRCISYLKENGCLALISAPSTLLIDVCCMGFDVSIFSIREIDFENKNIVLYPSRMNYSSLIFDCVICENELSMASSKFGVLFIFEQHVKKFLKKLIEFVNRELQK